MLIVLATSTVAFCTVGSNVLRSRSTLRPEVQAFCEWLQAQAAITRQTIGEGSDPDLEDLD